MLRFKVYLKEAYNDSATKLKHLEHLEDHVFNGREESEHAQSVLHDLHDNLKGNQTNTHVTTKYDGSPSLVFGHHPETGKFFVASKSIFNKDPKINYTNKDIKANHGHAPGLVDKLSHALKHLPKVTPKKGVFQGDIMHTGDHHIDNTHVHFQPNTIKYSTPKNSTHGQKTAQSKIAVAVHTAYHGNTLADMSAKYGYHPDEFANHKDVHIISARHTGKHTPISSEEDHLKAVRTLGHNMPEAAYQTTQHHAPMLKAFINDRVRANNSDTPTSNDFAAYMSHRLNKDVESKKSNLGRDKTRQKMHDTLNHISTNSSHLDKIFALHSHIQHAKNHLVNILSKHTDFEHSINNQPTKPEGFVAVRGNKPSKLVDRAEFSRANFAKER